MTQEVGTCYGDSGGPLTHFNGTHHVLVGVVSFGFVADCEELGVSEGYARVSERMDWIKENGDDYVKMCSY